MEPDLSALRRLTGDANKITGPERSEESHPFRVQTWYCAAREILRLR